MKGWVCANCKTPVDLRQPWADTDLSVYCPSDDPTCTPREDRWLLNDDQVELVDVAGGFTPEQLDALRGIVGQWIDEGFTTPPYGDAYYDIFERLGIDEDNPHSYDTRRPASEPGATSEQETA